MTTRRATVGCAASMFVVLTSVAARQTPPTAVQGGLTGTWLLHFADAQARRADAAASARRPSAVLDPNAVQAGGRGLNGEMDLTDLDERRAGVRDDAKYYNDHVGRSALVTAPRRLSIAVAAPSVTIMRDSESLTCDATGKSEPQTMAGLKLHVTSMWTASSLTQEITGDHHLKLEQLFQPSEDGRSLTVILTRNGAPLRVREAKGSRRYNGEWRRGTGRRLMRARQRVEWRCSLDMSSDRITPGARGTVSQNDASFASSAA